MMDVHLSELDLFSTAPISGIWKPSAEYGEVPCISKSTPLRAVAECRAEMEGLLGRCDIAFCTDQRAKVFQSRFHSEYLIHTRKGDTSAGQVQRYNIRDGVQWLAMWIGKDVVSTPLWNCLAKVVAFTGSLDDLYVPYADIAGGTYKFAGESLSELFSRLGSLGGDRDIRWLSDACQDVLFAGRMQFYEKWSACPDADARCPDEVNVINFYAPEPDPLRAAIFRCFSTMAVACLHLISFYYNFVYCDCDLALLHAAAIGDGLAMDIGKDAASIGVKCPTNFGERPENGVDENLRRRAAIYNVNLALNRYFRGATERRDLVYDRYARVALSFARQHDRYLERQDMTRFPIAGALRDLVERIALADGERLGGPVKPDSLRAGDNRAAAYMAAARVAEDYREGARLGDAVAVAF